MKYSTPFKDGNRFLEDDKLNKDRLHQISSPLIRELIVILMGCFFPTGRILPLVITQLNSLPRHWLPDQSNIHSEENKQEKRLVAIATYSTSCMVSNYDFIIRTGAY